MNWKINKLKVNWRIFILVFINVLIYVINIWNYHCKDQKIILKIVTIGKFILHIMKIKREKLVRTLSLRNVKFLEYMKYVWFHMWHFLVSKSYKFFLVQFQIR